MGISLQWSQRSEAAVDLEVQCIRHCLEAHSNEMCQAFCPCVQRSSATNNVDKMHILQLALQKED